MKRFIFTILTMASNAFAGGGGDAKDPSTWTPIKIPGAQRAPEFADVAEWIWPSY